MKRNRSPIRRRNSIEGENKYPTKERKVLLGIGSSKMEIELHLRKLKSCWVMGIEYRFLIFLGYPWLHCAWQKKC